MRFTVDRSSWSPIVRARLIASYSVQRYVDMRSVPKKLILEVIFVQDPLTMFIYHVSIGFLQAWLRLHPRYPLNDGACFMSSLSLRPCCRGCAHYQHKSCSLPKVPS